MSITDLIVPQTNVNDEDARVVEWHVSDGARVQAGDIVATIETAKAAEDVEAPVDGHIRILAPVDTTVAVGGRLALLAPSLEAFPDVVAPAEPNASHDLRATAKARELAALHDVDLSAIRTEGIISERHVRAAMEAASEPSPGEQNRERLTPVQKAVADTVMRSKREIGATFLLGEADVTEALTSIDRMADEQEILVALTDLVVYQAARILLEFPRLNAMLVGDTVQYHDEVNVGVAVEVKDALYLPTIRAANRSSLVDISSRRQELVMALLRGDIEASMLADGTFSVTLLEQPALLQQIPVIFPGQSGILGVGGIRDAFLPDPEGRPVLRKIAGLALSYDHRIVNGSYAARFLQAVAESLAAPVVAT